MAIKPAIKRLISIFQTKRQKEDKYYTALFTKNKAWNIPEPNSEEQMRWDIIKEFIESVTDKHTLDILDLGCGRGWLGNLLGEFGTVTAIEPVQKVVDFGKKLFPSLNISCGTSKDLIKNGNQGKFDLAVSSEVIEHINDKNKSDFVNDIYQLLKPGGYAIITTPRKDVELEWNKYLSANQPVEDWLTEAQLEKYFHEKNFITRNLKRFGIPPTADAPIIEIYQLWLFQKS